MKTLQKSKTLIACSIVAALTGCGSESYTPETKANVFSPEHGGDIVVNFKEKDAYKALNALGGLEGKLGTEGKAIDKDGDILFIRNATVTPVDALGIDISGPSFGISPQDIAPTINTGDTYTIVVEYEISDGKNSTPRTMTINIEGEDFAPVSSGPVLGNFSREAGSAQLDLLANTTDQDLDPLTVTDPVPDAGNTLVLPITRVDNIITLDISAVEADIPDGQLVSFNYTYQITDQNNTIDQTLIVNVLGVKAVAGAPIIPNYFLASAATEVDTVQEINLLDGVFDEEGDAIVIDNVQVNGIEGGTYGVKVSTDGILSFDPHAFFSEVAAGETKDYVISYNVSDVNGNIADGRPQLTMTLSGVETNMIAATGFNADFENPTNVGPIDGTNTNGFLIGWANGVCSVKEIRAESARTGMYGFRQEGSRCDTRITSSNFIEALASDSKLITSYWFRPEITGPNLNPWTIIAPALYFDDSRSAGRLFDDGVTNVWKEYARVIDTNEGGLYNDIVGSPLFHALSQYGGQTDQIGKNDIDDITLIDYGSYDVVAHDILINNAGTFDVSAPESSGGGTVEVVDGQLSIKTAGATIAADGVTVQFPLQAGAIKAGNRYVIDLDVVYSNFAANYPAGDATTKTPFYVAITNGVESFSTTVQDNGFVTTYTTDAVLSTDTNPAIVEWASEDLTLNITFTDVNAEYLVDNVRLIAIPN